MPTIAITSMTASTPVAINMFGHLLFALLPKTASTDGARTTVAAMVPSRLAAIMIQPVRKPR